MKNQQRNETDRADKAVLEQSAKASRSNHRLYYHIMAPSGWINDPNGLIQYQNEYHVFYQHHPFSPKWGPMYWGHVTSPDLIHWNCQPIALAPDEEFEQGCFSGSAVESDGRLTLIYTSHDDRRSPKEVQCIAHSSDGIRFYKYRGNPVIGSLPQQVSGESPVSEDFRDPKVFREDGIWKMIVGSSENSHGEALMFQSKDLINWDYSGVLCKSDGSQGTMWECPDFFHLNDQAVLMVSPMNMEGHKNIFLLGNYDRQTAKFTADSIQEVDCGHDFYAAQTFLTHDGRRILIAWMDSWDGVFPTQEYGWAGALTIPREVYLHENGRVHTRPVREAELLRQKKLMEAKFRLTPQSPADIRKIRGDHLEICLTVVFDNPACSKFGMNLRRTPDETQSTLLTILPTEKLLTLDTGRSGSGRKSTASLQLGTVKNENSLRVNLRIFIDSCSVEIFINDGEAVITERIYPSPEAQLYDVFSEGGDCLIENLSSWELENIWENQSSQIDYSAQG